MSDSEERLIELEIRYTEQSALLEELSSELYKANEVIDELKLRIKRLEKTSLDLLNRQELPPNEKPPHY